ncbi:hypothetical protein Tco_0934085, partial [Tanacetum coccineum]
TRAMDYKRKQVKVTTRGSQVKARTKEMSLQTLESGLVLIYTEGKTYVMRYTSSHHPRAYRSTLSMNTKTKLTNQADKCVYRKFDESGIFVIKVLYERHGGDLGLNMKAMEFLPLRLMRTRFSRRADGSADSYLYFYCLDSSTAATDNGKGYEVDLFAFLKKEQSRGREREEAATIPHELLTRAVL